MNNPANVPPITDVRFTAWDQRKPSGKQLWLLNELLLSEGVDIAQLYGDGFTYMDDLSMWAVSWGITFLTASREARWMEDNRRRIEERNQELRDEAGKKLMGMILREHMREKSRG